MGDASEIKWSVQNGDIEKVKQAVEKDPKVVQQEVGMGQFLIHSAADYGQADVLTFLIANGADVNIKDKHGITPLLNAVFEGHTACVKILLEKGADKSVKAPSGQSVLESAEKEEIKALLR